MSGMDVHDALQAVMRCLHIAASASRMAHASVALVPGRGRRPAATLQNIAERARCRRCGLRDRCELAVVKTLVEEGFVDVRAECR